MFTLHGSQCLLNVYFAYNAGASGGLGDVAAYSSAGYWRYLFEKNKIPYESCGQDNKGIKSSEDKLFTLILAPYAMTATFNRFWETSSIQVLEKADLYYYEHDRAFTCYSRESEDGPTDKYLFGCNW